MKKILITAFVVIALIVYACYPTKKVIYFNHNNIWVTMVCDYSYLDNKNLYYFYPNKISKNNLDNASYYYLIEVTPLVNGNSAVLYFSDDNKALLFDINHTIKEYIVKNDFISKNKPLIFFTDESTALFYDSTCTYIKSSGSEDLKDGSIVTPTFIRKNAYN